MKQDFQKQEKFFRYIDQSIVKNKKISHAYLIEVTNIPEYMVYVLEMVKEILSIDYSKDSLERKKIDRQIDEGVYPDLKVIKPDGSWIKKEQLIQLEAEFSKKSMLDNKLIYIIDKAEYLNDSSANTILKFLEEPAPDIIAILLTNNKYRVLDTIVSRCQTLSLITGDLSFDLDSKILSFIQDIHSKKSLILSFDFYMKELFLDRETSKKNLELLQNYFCYSLDQNYIEGQYNGILKDIEPKKIVRYIDIFSNAKERLQYNVNLKLWLTDLLIQLMEVF